MLGFSNGGDRVISIANWLAKQQIKVDLVITVDPVNHPLKLVTLNDPFNPGIFKKQVNRPPNVGKWFNFYQRIDNLHIRGMKVVGADKNVEITATDFRQKKGQNVAGAHIFMPTMPTVIDSIDRELRKLSPYRNSYEFRAKSQAK